MVSTVVASTRRGQLEALDGEGKVLVIGIVDQEAMVDALLQALGLIALRNKRARRARSGALLNTGRLGEGLVVSLDMVDHDPPLAMDVDGTEGLDVGSLGRAQIGLLHDVLQMVHRVLSVGQHILVQLLDSIIVVLNGLLDLIGGVLRILQAVGLGVSMGTLGRSIVGLMMRSCRMVGSSMVRRRVMGRRVVGRGVGSVVGGRGVGGGSLMAIHRGVAVGRGRSVGGRSVGGRGVRSGRVRRCMVRGVMRRRVVRRWVVWRRVVRGVVVRGPVVSAQIGVRRGLRFGLCVGEGDGHHRGEHHPSLHVVVFTKHTQYENE